MQCVFICAGKGTRMMPLTADTPKPLLPVCGKPILVHTIEGLPPLITELIFVIGYRGEQIRAYFGNEYAGRPVRYVEQANYAGGTGEALMCARPVVHGKFLFLNGDDIYGRDGLARIVEEEHAIFSMTSDTPERFGVLVPNDDGTLSAIIEKPQHPTSNIVNIGGYVVHDAIFTYDIPVSSSGELYATDFVTAYANDYPVHIVPQDLWLPIGYPEHIAAAEAVLCPDRVEAAG